MIAALLLPLAAASAAAAVARSGAGAAAGPPAELQLVDGARFPLARCLDGSRPPFYHRPATSAGSKDKWFVHHMGGDFCGYGDTWADWTDDCRRRANSTLGSSSWYA